MGAKVQLEKILTTAVRKQEPLASDVTVSLDGQFAIYRVADRYTFLKLSEASKKFLREGGDVAAVVSPFQG